MIRGADTTTFTQNKATIACLRAHLIEADACFVPPLSSRLDLATYAAKLHSRAERLEAWDGKVLVGLVAVYCNANSAFVSSVSVVPRWQRRGVARQLMGHCLCLASMHQMPFITLEVCSQALPAISLYRSLGFELQAESATQCTLRLSLPTVENVELS